MKNIVIAINGWSVVYFEQHDKCTEYFYTFVKVKVVLHSNITLVRYISKVKVKCFL